MEKSTKVADKYNGYQLDRVSKYGLFMDYLIINLEGIPVLKADGLKADVQEYGTKVFKERVNLTFEGQKFGVLTYSPRSRIIREDLCQLKIENHLFYTMSLEALREMIERALVVLSLEYVAVNRLDIALDFNESTHCTKNMIQRLNNGTVLISGREKEVQLNAVTKKGVMTFQGIRIGSRTSSRFLRIYNKTIEKEKVVKTYISDAWEKIGIKENENNHVWRYEYQLSGTFVNSLNGVDLETIFSRIGLFNVLRKANKNHFQLKINTGKTEVNKEQDFNYVNFNEVARSMGVIVGDIVPLKRTIKETLIGQQRVLKSLLRNYVSGGQMETYIPTIKAIVKSFDLADWFYKKLPYYLDEFQQAQMFKDFDRELLNEQLHAHS